MARKANTPRTGGPKPNPSQARPAPARGVPVEKAADPSLTNDSQRRNVASGWPGQGGGGGHEGGGEGQGGGSQPQQGGQTEKSE